LITGVAGVTAGLALTTAGCTSEPGDPLGVMNYVAVGVTDFATSMRYYSQTLGIKIYEQSGQWAEPVNGWHDYQTMVWEVFGGAAASPPTRSWGSGCNLRPVIFVEDPDSIVAALESKGVAFNGDFVDEGWRRLIEFQDPDRIPWAVGEATGFRRSPSMEAPCICGVDIKAADLDAQVEFYTEVMGMTVAQQDPQVVLVQEGGDAFLTLQPGGERIATQKLETDSNTLSLDSPLHFSWMISDLEAAIARVTAAGAPVIKELATRPWGRVFMTADPDGNFIPFVDYNASHSPD